MCPHFIPIPYFLCCSVNTEQGAGTGEDNQTHTKTDYRQATVHKLGTDGRHREKQRTRIWVHSWSKTPQKEVRLPPPLQFPPVTSTM